MRKKVVVLGAGMVGRAMAIDLSKQNDVLSVDRDAGALALLASHSSLVTKQADLGDAASVTGVIADADIVVGAVPGFMGFKTLETVIAAGKNIVDISFFSENPFELDALAKAQGVIAVMDAGVAPGMSNIILGSYQNEMKVTDYICYVGGLPRERIWPYEYKAPFSPIDVIAEYTRPSRIVENSELVQRVALSEPELIDFPGVGTLEAFNTDGLRSLVHTMKIPNMIEKTLRYPGHIELMRVLRETGFFGEQHVQIGDQSIRPIDLTTSLLFPKWKLGEEEEEFTVMNILVEGLKAGKNFKHKYELLDRYDPTTKTSSMARTTGYTCTAITQLVLDGQYSRIGISPPEYVGATQGCLETVFNYLEQRGVIYKKSSVEG
ncbi:MAG: saccharopine dehydrogenase [Candidatus Marinimicrobia bacterium]|jgi:saccharopine dehydrogenase-like NADP-dependent oxidoreductase|nr:saccharopine dehydrogenase [Candidatus Neomarinimicrobiota bacterium]MBT3631071.1 saccharopine dehydrogenase [Candidatus Neomarinimicrobiota bacterium]MBT3825711.1 saccharopine dehydrogenase [Candidatus Neomarinimicrobiota bacterium]MBT4130545.1 saccharopine dehydrogenase [Candidatus Neomarinimicrobiota bacterium]MBT4296234.1 saccharopine dehydrogenase [Candidatus Neomarinimicrobiota bacterium]